MQICPCTWWTNPTFYQIDCLKCWNASSYARRMRMKNGESLSTRAICNESRFNVIVTLTHSTLLCLWIIPDGSLHNPCLTYYYSVSKRRWLDLTKKSRFSWWQARGEFSFQSSVEWVEVINHLGWMPPQAEFPVTEKHSSKLFNLIDPSLAAPLSTLATAAFAHHIISTQERRSLYSWWECSLYAILKRYVRQWNELVWRAWVVARTRNYPAHYEPKMGDVESICFPVIFTEQPDMVFTHRYLFWRELTILIRSGFFRRRCQKR